jgi:cobalt-zinc-cadmium efflux system outer membrane protein
LTALAAAALAGCAATVPEDAGFADVERVIAERIPQHRVVWDRGSGEDLAVQAAVRELLADELTPDEAVQIALLNNRGLQATYEDLGIAQADLVQAGLLSNPVFSAKARWTFDPSEGAELGFDLIQNFLDLLMLPARKRLAAVEFEETKLRVAGEILDLAVETREAYFAYQAAEQTARVLREIAAATQASYDLARRLDEAGNISERSLAAEQAALEQAKVDLAELEVTAYAERERLNRLMGLWGEVTAEWTVLDGLPDLPPETLPFERIEALAIQGNLELAAAHKEVQALATALGITRDYRWVGDVEVAIEYERETDDRNLLGPRIAFALPVFDQGQPRIARAVALLRQSEHRLARRAVDIRSEVRAIRDRLVRLRDLAEHYRTVVIPLNQRLVELSLQEYNYMLIGPFDVLTAKRNEIAAYRNYIETVRDWWIASAEVERLLGGQPVLAGSVRSGTPSPMAHAPSPPTDAHAHDGES